MLNKNENNFSEAWSELSGNFFLKIQRFKNKRTYTKNFLKIIFPSYANLGTQFDILTNSP